MSAAKMEKKLARLEHKLRVELVAEFELVLKRYEHRLRALEEQLGDNFSLGEAGANPPRTREAWNSCDANDTEVRIITESAVVNADLGAVVPIQSSSTAMTSQLSKKRMSLYDSTHEEYEPVPFSESVWNLVLVFDATDAHYTDLAVSIFLLLLNMFMQVMFVIIVQSDNFLGATMDSQKANADAWRRSVAHDHVYMNFAKVSLASRVCSGDASLIYSNEQSSLLSEINAYLELSSNQSDSNYLSARRTLVSQGPILCGLCIMLWLLYMCHELRSNWLSVWAISRVQRASYTELNENKLLRISYVRLAAFLVLQVIRTAVCVMLLFSGILWLANTTSIQDLILNAVALGAVLDIDSIVFAAMMPAKMQLAIQDLEAIKVRYTPRRSQIEAIVIFLFTTTVSFSSFLLLVIPLTLDMQDVKAHFCDGQQNFVVAENSDSQMLYAKETNPPNTGSKGVLELAVEDAIHLSDWGDSKFFWLANTFDEFDKKRVESMQAEASSLFNVNWDACYDTNFSTAAISNHSGDELTWTLDQLKLFNNAKTRLGQSYAAVCEDLKSFCGHGDSRLLRYVCPTTCGCSDPFGDRFYRVPGFGCKAGCQLLTTIYASERPCVSKRNLGPGWSTFWDRWVNRSLADLGMDETGEVAQTRLLPWAAQFKDEGCTAFMRLGQNDPVSNANFCTGEGTTMFAGLQSMCPEECLCQADPNTSPNCPTTCRPCEDAPGGPPDSFGVDDCLQVFRQGYCQVFPEQSQQYCYKTCGFCSCVDAEPEDFPPRLPLQTCSAAKAAGLCDSDDAKLYCSATCGVCTVDTPCEDAPFPRGWGVESCEEAKALQWCYDNTVAAMCPATCGSCQDYSSGDPNCSDAPAFPPDLEVGSCTEAQAAGWCSADEMERLCAATCGFCAPASSSSTSGNVTAACADAPDFPADLGVSDCAEAKAAGWCSEADAKALCGLTCGLCNSSDSG